ncbi:baculoviral IAP repeat-containing protein 5 [Drosophila busckii]|nr:baculoviral IAP repeat-containing protein 5 [Drosophila busckii]
MNTTVDMNENKLESFREFHVLEKHRMESYKDWPFPADSACSINKMAEAGFYWTGNAREPDTVTCFVCGKTLDGWESEDDPWKEHLRHAPQCEYAKLGCKEKDLTVGQFLKIFTNVVNKKIEMNVKKFKANFTKKNEAKLDEFVKLHY